MSSRANSSARTRRAGPSSNIQDTLTTNPQPSHTSYNPNTFSEKNQEPKLLSLTQAFMLINGKIRTLETQVENMTKIIENVQNNESITPVCHSNYEEMSDVSEYRPVALDEAFYVSDKNPKLVSSQGTDTASMYNGFDEVKARALVSGITSTTFEQHESQINKLEADNKDFVSQYTDLNTRTNDISQKLQNIEELVKSIQELNAKLPAFMASVDSRFDNLKANTGSSDTLMVSTMSKVNDVLDNYNNKIEGVQKSMTNMQEYAVSLHNLFIKRFDTFVDDNFEKKQASRNNIQTSSNTLVAENERKVLNDLQQSKETSYGSCQINTNDSDDEEEAGEES